MDVASKSSIQGERSYVIERLPKCIDLLSLHQLNPPRYPHLLESVAQGEKNTRYDILFAFPQEQLELTADQVHQNDFLSTFDCAWANHAIAPCPNGNELPFTGGWFLYLSYELAQQIEPTLNLKIDSSSPIPLAFATRIPAAVIVDHQEQLCFLVVEAGFESCIDDMKNDVLQLPCVDQEQESAVNLLQIDEDDPSVYLGGVCKIKEYILDGDIFQVNLSRAWRAQAPADMQGYGLYRQLRRANPAPFAGLVTYNNSAIVSSSPERLVSVRAGVVETRPIAGTRPRGEEKDQDKALSDTLMQHPKEIAEHIMLIDLERNDLGRISQPGSVEVDELMCLESYRHVHHIVSNVRGKLREGVTPGETIRAVFPGGTITGCPKVRCMEIINELEHEPRGAYTGSFGYVNHDGSMDLNILIRTLTLANKQITLRAGAGIVADSEPLMELEESRAKARGLLKAIQNDLD